MTHAMATPYDSEMVAIYKVRDELQERFAKTSMNPQDFVDYAIEAYQKIGIVADVKTWSTGTVEGNHPITGEMMVQEVPNLWTFEIEILGRTKRHEFDHDRMAHEVQHNILGLQDDGPSQIKASKDTDSLIKQYTKGHRH
jgi:hypothetical protein